MVHIMIAILLMGDILQMQLTVYFSIHEEYKLYMDTSWLVQP